MFERLRELVGPDPSDGAVIELALLLAIELVDLPGVAVSLVASDRQLGGTQPTTPGRVVIQPGGFVNMAALMKADSVTLVDTGRLLIGDEAKAQKASTAERIPIRPPPPKPKMRQ